MGELAVFPAAKWNEWAKKVRRAFPLRGMNARLSYRAAGGIAIEVDDAPEWPHPWQLTCDWETYIDDDKNEKSEWRARVRPGFVNGRDAFISMPENWPKSTAPGENPYDVPLTDDPAPFLRLNDWRNPLKPQGTDDDASTDAEDVVYLAGEPIPAFFPSIGVKSPAPGGKSFEGGDTPVSSDTQNRELRACDLILTKPRLGSALSVNVYNPIAGDPYVSTVTTVYKDDYYTMTGGRSRLGIIYKYDPTTGAGSQYLNGPSSSIPIDDDEDPQFDQLKIATIYAVSQPFGDSDADPDDTWTMYVKYNVFWNIWHVTRFVPDQNVTDTPITFFSPLGLGMINLIAASILAPINSAMEEVMQFLQAADLRGRFYNL